MRSDLRSLLYRQTVSKSRIFLFRYDQTINILGQRLLRNSSINIKQVFFSFNPLTPNDRYCGRTAPLTSKHFILYIYSTNTSTEYFKHGIYSPFFLFKMQFVS